MRPLLPRAPFLIAILAISVFAQGPGMPARDGDELLARAAANSRRMPETQRLGAHVERTRDGRSFALVWRPPGPPEAAAGGAIGLVEEGDTIEIDIPNRRIHLAVEESALAARRAAMEARGPGEHGAWKPLGRQREVSSALKAYAAMTTSADTGAVRDIAQLS